MDIKLFDSELKVMDVLWKRGDTPAKEIARTLTIDLGWNVNTTYTLIKRCMKKGAIERSEPGFLCHALIPKSAVQEAARPAARRRAAAHAHLRVQVERPTAVRPFCATGTTELRGAASPAGDAHLHRTLHLTRGEAVMRREGRRLSRP